MPSVHPLLPTLLHGFESHSLVSVPAQFSSTLRGDEPNGIAALKMQPYALQEASGCSVLPRINVPAHQEIRVGSGRFSAGHTQLLGTPRYSVSRCRQLKHPLAVPPAAAIAHLRAARIQELAESSRVLTAQLQWVGCFGTHVASLHAPTSSTSEAEQAHF